MMMFLEVFLWYWEGLLLRQACLRTGIRVRKKLPQLKAMVPYIIGFEQGQPRDVCSAALANAFEQRGRWN